MNSGKRASRLESARSRSSEIRRKAQGPSAQTLAASLLGQALIVISGIVAARALGVSGRGTLALLWLVPLILSLLGGLGIPQATTYFVARAGDNARHIIRISAGIIALLAIGLFVIYGIGLLVVGDQTRFSTADGLLSAALVPTLLAQSLAIATLLGLKRYSAFNLSRLLPVSLYALGTAALYVTGLATLTSILGVWVASWATAAICSWIVVVNGLPEGEGSSEVGSRDILLFGLRGVIGTISPIDDVRVDQLFVGLILDARALGLYVAAVAFSNLPRFVAQSIGSVNYPRVAAAREPSEAWATATHAAKLGFLAVSGTVAALLVVMPTLLPLLFGEDFSDAVEIGYVLLVAAYFLSIHRLLTELARGLGHPGYGSITELVNLGVFLIGLLIFASPATATGIATAVVGGAVASLLVLSSLLFRLRKKQLPGPTEQ